MATPKLVTALLCDDVRTENTSKDILIGVYHGGVVVNRLPAILRLVLYLQIDIGLSPLKTNMSVRILGPDEAPMFSGVGEVTDFVAPMAAVVLLLAPVQLKHVGTHKVQIRFGKGRWQTAREMAIDQNPSAPTSGGGLSIGNLSS